MGSLFSLSDLRALLSDAEKKVPAVRYARGVLGICVVGWIGLAIFQHSYLVAALTVPIVLGFMVVLFVFARLTRTKSKSVFYAGLTMMWVAVACFVTIMAGLSSDLLTGWPPIIEGMSPESPQCTETEVRMKALSRSIDNFISDQCILADRISIFVSSGNSGDWERVPTMVQTFSTDVEALKQKMRDDQDLHDALRFSFTDFDVLLDEKDGIIHKSILRGTMPPSDRQALGGLSKDLRDLATKAAKKTASVRTYTLSSCRRPTSLPSRFEGCPNP